MSKFDSLVKTYSLRLSNGDTVSFEDCAELRVWLESQLRLYDKIKNGVLTFGAEIPPRLMLAIDLVIKLLSQLDRFIDDPDGEYHDKVEFGAFLSGVGMVFDAGNYNVVTTMHSLSGKILESLKRDLNQALHLIEDSFKRIPVDDAKVIQDDTLSERIEKEVEKLQLELDRSEERYKKSLEENADWIAKVKSTEAALKEKTSLSASEKYWLQKSITHWARFVTFFLVLATWVSLGFLHLEEKLSVYKNDVRNASDIFDLVPFLPLNVLLILFFVWGTRFFLKLLFSENHLANMATEKRTLLLTYFALIQEGQVEQEDRQALLGQVFTLSQDGFVDEDTMPKPTMNPINIFNEITNPNQGQNK